MSFSWSVISFNSGAVALLPETWTNQGARSRSVFEHEARSSTTDFDPCFGAIIIMDKTAFVAPELPRVSRSSRPNN
jgi:hypothetical protein